MKELFSPRYWLLNIWPGFKVHGQSRWMSRRERRRFFSRKHTGLILGHTGGPWGKERRMSQADSFKNLALVAPTGSGKTTRFVIPNLLGLEGSAVVTDPSGEIYRATSGHLAHRGFEVQAIRMADAARSLRFNPLAYLQGHQELRALAQTLAEHGNQGESNQGSEPFWTHGATDILYITLTALMNVGDPRYRNLANVRWLLNHFGHSGEGLKGFFARHLDERMRAEFVGFAHQDPKVIASILSTARAGLSLWNDPEVCRLTASDSVRLSELRHRPTVTYLIVPEHRIPYFSLILNLFYRSCFQACLEHWDEAAADAGTLLPVYFFLDEFGNLGRIPGFSSVVTTLRKRRCCTTLILQQPSQLRAIYGRDAAETILEGGCASKLYLSGLDARTAFEVEQSLGQETVSELSWGDNTRRLGKPLLRAEEIRRLPKTQAVLISGSERPATLTLPGYYAVPRWKAQASIAPLPFPEAQGDEDVPYLPLRKPAATQASTPILAAI